MYAHMNSAMYLVIFTVQLFYLFDESYALHYAGEKMSSLYCFFLMIIFCSNNIIVVNTTIVLDNNSIIIVQFTYF